MKAEHANPCASPYRAGVDDIAYSKDKTSLQRKIRNVVAKSSYELCKDLRILYYETEGFSFLYGKTYDFSGIDKAALQAASLNRIEWEKYEINFDSKKARFILFDKKNLKLIMLKPSIKTSLYAKFMLMHKIVSSFIHRCKAQRKKRKEENEKLQDEAMSLLSKEGE